MDSLKYLKPLGSNWHHPPAPDIMLHEERLTHPSLGRLQRVSKRSDHGALDIVLRERAPACVAKVDITERKFYISTGKRRIRKKDGKPGSEEKIPVILVTVTATVSDGKRTFFFRVTNRSRKVFDSRDNQRKPLAYVRAELFRMCQPDTADRTTAALVEYMRPS
jgi:hypothetical protein